MDKFFNDLINPTTLYVKVGRWLVPIASVAVMLQRMGLI